MYVAKKTLIYMQCILKLKKKKMYNKVQILLFLFEICKI